MTRIDSAACKTNGHRVIAFTSVEYGDVVAHKVVLRTSRRQPSVFDSTVSYDDFVLATVRMVRLVRILSSTSM